MVILHMMYADNDNASLDWFLYSSLKVLLCCSDRNSHETGLLEKDLGNSDNHFLHMGLLAPHLLSSVSPPATLGDLLATQQQIFLCIFVLFYLGQNHNVFSKYREILFHQDLLVAH